MHSRQNKQWNVGVLSKYSVVVPNYGRSRTLLDALNSVCIQIHLPEEVYIIDDCSPKPIEGLVNDLKHQKKIPILLEVNDANRGAAYSRNRGANLTKSHYIAFLDSDDTWEEDKLEKQLKLAASGDFDLVYCDCWMMTRGVKLPSNKLLVDDRIDEHLTNGWTPPNTSTLLVKKDSFMKLGGFDESLKSCQDHDFWMRAVSAGWKIGVVKEPLSNFRLDENDRISFNHINRMHGVREFLRKWKPLISERKGYLGFTMFKLNYYCKASMPIFLRYVKFCKSRPAMELFLRYLAYNPYFYTQVPKMVAHKLKLLSSR